MACYGSLWTNNWCVITVIVQSDCTTPCLYCFEKSMINFRFLPKGDGLFLGEFDCAHISIAIPVSDCAELFDYVFYFTWTFYIQIIFKFAEY